MAGNFVLLVFTGLLAAAAVYFVPNWQKRKRANPQGLPYPPGPKPEFLIGNLRHMPFAQPWLQFTEWKKVYGDMVHLNVVGQHFLVLNSWDCVNDLLHKRVTYAGRPQFTMVSELMGWKRIIPFTDYGETFRRYRRIIHPHLNTVVSAQHKPIHEKQRDFCLQRLLESPETFREDLRLAAGKSILMLTYGLEVHSPTDPYIVIPETAMENLQHVVKPGAYLANYISFLKYVPGWFPGAGFQTVAKDGRVIVEEMANKPFDHTKRNMVEGSVVPSVVSAGLAAMDNDPEEEDLLKWAAATMYIGGADTTVSVVANFYLTMTLHPEAQKKAQAELDRVVGIDRLPTFEDRENLPYVEALVKEVIRWRPILPLGFAHKAIQADTYQGYFIPEGTIVQPNVWALSRNEDMFPNAERFQPERFLSPNKLGEIPTDPFKFMFGFGRRICPGIHFANDSLFLTIASILATFAILKPLDENGNEVTPPGDFIDGMLIKPKDFGCRIVPRSDRASGLVRALET